MKKIFTFLVLALVAMTASAQEPLYTFQTKLAADPEWGAEYAPYFAFPGTEVTVEVYADDYVIIKNWAGAEGCDLKVEYDSSIDVDDEDCGGNILALTTIINGVEQEPVNSYSKESEGHTYNYVDIATGREDYPICSTSLNEDGTVYWSFVEVDNEAQTGYVELSAYFMTADYDTENLAGSYYYCAWPEETGPEFYGTFKGYVAEYLTEDGNIDSSYGSAFLKDYSVNIDVYDQYIIIHDYSNTPENPRELKISCTHDDTQYMTSLIHTLVSTGKDTDLTAGGYLYTGSSSIDGADYIYAVKTFDCSQGYNVAEWDKTSGYAMILGYAYFKDSDNKVISGKSEWTHYYVYWGGAEEGVQLLYSSTGKYDVAEDWDDYATYFKNVGSKAQVEVYDDNSIIVRAFAGVEGYDIKVWYDEEENVTAIAAVTNGVEGEKVTSGKATVPAGNDVTYDFVLEPEYNYAASYNDDKEGYIFLYADGYNYFYLYWPEEEDSAINAVQGSSAMVHGSIFNLAGQRTTQHFKGIVITNGKKMMVK